MISKYISYKEATKSQTATRLGIDNKPTEDHLAAMKHVAREVFDKVRAHFGVPLGVSSFYRGPELNKAIGGSKTSQHMKGEAIDIDADMYGGVTNKEIFDYIKDNLTFDQLINEFNYSWVHVSLRRDGKNRGQVLEAYSENGKTKYKEI